VTDGRTDGHAATADNYNDVDDIWNSLPEEIMTSSSVNSFKNKL